MALRNAVCVVFGCNNSRKPLALRSRKALALRSRKALALRSRKAVRNSKSDNTNFAGVCRFIGRLFDFKNVSNRKSVRVHKLH